MKIGNFKIESCEAFFFDVPTSRVECDGTLCWSSTGLLYVELKCEGLIGMGYSYTDGSAVLLIRHRLAEHVKAQNPLRTEYISNHLRRQVRNIGVQGIAASAISAIDIAVWDLKAQLLGVPLVELLGLQNEKVPAYASGGFTSSSIDLLLEEMQEWKAMGFTRFKMKVGSRPEQDTSRVKQVRQTVGASSQLFVDANGAYSVQQALQIGEAFHSDGVSWFEEPVSSDNIEGLRYVRQRLPRGMEVAAGEYGWDGFHFQRLLKEDAVDVLQIDVTRCGGITNFIKISHLAEIHQVPISCHTAPYLHADLACCVSRLRHVEVFFDHKKIEEELFEKKCKLRDGMILPNTSAPGLGMKLNWSEAKIYAA